MCRRKKEVDLVFIDNRRFNQALLSKQAWRIWDLPNSLLSKILKSLYFKNSIFYNIVNELYHPMVGASSSLSEIFLLRASAKQLVTDSHIPFQENDA